MKIEKNNFVHPKRTVTLISGQNFGKLDMAEVAPIVAEQGKRLYYLQARGEKRTQRKMMMTAIEL